MKFLPIEKSQLSQYLSKWLAMRKEIYPSLEEEFHEQEMVQTLDSPHWYCHFILNDAGDICGLVELSSRNIVDGCLTSPVAYIEGLYLEPELRGKGVGREVMNMIMQWSKQKGFSELATDAELLNTNAQSFYVACGFKEIDRVVEYRIEIKE